MCAIFFPTSSRPTEQGTADDFSRWAAVEFHSGFELLVWVGYTEGRLAPYRVFKLTIVMPPRASAGLEITMVQIHWLLASSELLLVPLGRDRLHGRILALNHTGCLLRQCFTRVFSVCFLFDNRNSRKSVGFQPEPDRVGSDWPVSHATWLGPPYAARYSTMQYSIIVLMRCWTFDISLLPRTDCNTTLVSVQNSRPFHSKTGQSEHDQNRPSVCCALAGGTGPIFLPRFIRWWPSLAGWHG